MKYKNELELELEKISSCLFKNYLKEEQIGCMSGLSGIAMFHFHYASYKKEPKSAWQGINILSYVVDKINDGYHLPTFCAGISGAGWAFEYLQQSGFFESDNDELLESLDEYLAACMEADLKRGYYDFLHGAIGYGCYFLIRFKYTKSDQLKKQYQEYLLKLIKELDKLSKKEQNTVFWEFKDIIEDQTHHCNFSLSHGISSVANFLGRLYLEPEFKEIVSPMLEGTIQKILKHQFLHDDGFSFPSILGHDLKERGGHRLAWCYGDLGISFTLFQLGRNLNRPELEINALVILKNLAKMRGNTKTQIKDAGICHGAYGVAHIFNICYHMTNDPIFLEAVEYWIQQGLAMAIHEDGYAGYMQWNPSDEDNWKKYLGILEGIAGIGLVMISYLSEEELGWSGCLFLNDF